MTSAVRKAAGCRLYVITVNESEVYGSLLTHWIDWKGGYFGRLFLTFLS